MRKTILALFAGAAIACAFAGTAFAASDEAFLTDAIKGDNAEIALGKLAASHAHSEGVRAYGSMLVKDHGKAKVQAMMLARRQGISPPSDMMPDAKKKLTELKSMFGNAFDKAFMKDMVTNHKKDIAAYKEEADKGKGPVADLAKKTLPTLQKHLTAAQKISG